MRNKTRTKARTAHGTVHIRSSFSQMMITVTDTDGNAIAWTATSDDDVSRTAAQAAETAAKAAMNKGIESVKVIVKGPGKNREPAIRALMDAGLEVTMIKDATPIPHNGCRPAPKRTGNT